MEVSGQRQRLCSGVATAFSTRILAGQPFLQTVANQPWGLIREQLGTDPTVTFANPFAFPGQPSTLPAFTPYRPPRHLTEVR